MNWFYEAFTFWSEKAFPHLSKDVYHYSLFPAGKLFRPTLAAKLYEDLTGLTDFTVKDPLPLLCVALEWHHVYSLIHDDLPCMDDDDFRRGRESSHKKFNEWKALLAGDGLINATYYLLSKIKHPRAQDLISFASWSLGPKGLIHGQELDLSCKDISFKDVIRIHELKTGRLMQLACVGTHYLAGSKSIKGPMKMGRLIGVIFQLLDDLGELEEELSEHEKKVNPFVRDFSSAENYLIAQLKKWDYESKEFTQTRCFVNKLFKRMIPQRRDSLRYFLGD